MSRLVPLLLALSLAGCSTSRNGRPEELGRRRIEGRGQPDAAHPSRWQQVLVGVPRPKLRGYLKAVQLDVGVRAERPEMYLVYDDDFTLVGRISPRGEVVRLEVRGDETQLGTFYLPKGVLLLLTGDLSQELTLAPMPAPQPRSLEAKKRGSAALPQDQRAVTTW